MGIHLKQAEWALSKKTHELKVASLLKDHLERRSRGIAHPVFDFLFDYYSFRPSYLGIWSPGVGVVLETNQDEILPALAWDKHPFGFTLALDKLNATRSESLRWVINLLQQTSHRSPRFGCHGLHEWAMVYRSEEFRYQNKTPLRLSLEEIERVVEVQPLACTHYDAFRFFTPKARPLNWVELSKTSRLDLEQRGCLHVNMDLYKWASKYWPWVSSKLVLEAFELAKDARIVDMRASPYDLRSLGFEPICIETEKGKKEYETEQRRISESAFALRGNLIGALSAILKELELRTELIHA